MAEITVDGAGVPVEPGQTIAAALWQSGRRSWRTTRVAGRARGIFCGIGACYDCLLSVDGVTGQRACVTPARPGAVVTTTGDPSSVGTGDGSPGPVGPPAPRRPGRDRYDVIVVGAGPAGLAAAATAALSGGRVALLDAAPRPGGQFWRHRDAAPGNGTGPGNGTAGGHTTAAGYASAAGYGDPGRGYRDWSVFTGLVSVVEERVDYLPEATVWFAEAGFTLHTTVGRFAAGQVVLATGAYDRALPFPGWDLPGVVTPGAAQALLKGSGVAIGRTVVVAGAGPFLLPVAVGLADAGVRVVGVYEAGHPGDYLRRPGALAGVAGKLGEAAGYVAALARRRIPYRIGHAVIAARGTEATGVSGVDIAKLHDGRMVPGSVQTVACDAVAVGYGFTANLELALLLGCGTRRGADGGLAVRTGTDGQTTVPGLFAAGEIAGVGGSALALVTGEIAGSAAARAAGAPAPLSSRDLAGLRRRRDRLRAFADSMHAAHAVPAGWMSTLDDDTLLCRCEEVSCGDVRRAVTELGATDARTVKLLARPGMGWCQGRVCGYPTAELTAHLCGRAADRDDLLAFAQRPFAAPVRLGDLAQS
jgi:NADPH-dependent 2,4-dienoyl-CoA reductase/sulfur reductase-like enzyme